MNMRCSLHFCGLLFALLLRHAHLAAALECAPADGQEPRAIPDAWIDDDYCDCPVDGADEPSTNACSGSSLWVGFADKVSSSIDTSSWISCPQQPKLRLPSSRINDGICDCCDGADEPSSSAVCVDICDEVLAEERAAREKAFKDFDAGSKIRGEKLQEFQNLLQQTIVDIESKEKELEKVSGWIDEKTTEITDTHIQYMDSRRRLMLQTVQSGFLSELLKPLTNEELAFLIQSMCQLNAEMDDPSEGEDTCVALRLAGMDVGLVWEEENWTDCSTTMTRVTGDDRATLAKMIHSISKGEKVLYMDDVAENGRSKRRRLDDYPVDDDYMGDENEFGDYDYDESYEDEDYEEAEYQRERQRQERNNASNVGGQRKEYTEKRKELQDLIESSPLSRSRKIFMDKADELVSTIETVRDEMMPEDENEDSEGEQTAETEKAVPTVDPMIFQANPTTLRNRQQRIVKGYEWAASSKILLDCILQSDEKQHQVRTDLWNLAGATLFYSDVSAEYIWQILSLYSIREKVSANAEGAQTCASPLADICPPHTELRSGKSFPPVQLVNVGQSACEHALEEVIEQVCPPDLKDAWQVIPDGLFGYYSVQARDSEDLFERSFSSLEDLEEKKSSTDELEENIKLLKEKKNELEKEIKDLDMEIGGRDEWKYGESGELHAVKDECFAVDAGKYTYEVCPFQRAHQRDKGQRAGGTSLGTWVGMEVHIDGTRTMKWENGQKCWNGPKRSATVHIVRCGPENKLLSAEEPDTCTYEMEMESFIACDEAYFNSHLATS